MPQLIGYLGLQRNKTVLDEQNLVHAVARPGQHLLGDQGYGRYAGPYAVKFLGRNCLQ